MYCKEKIRIPKKVRVVTSFIDGGEVLVVLEDERKGREGRYLVEYDGKEFICSCGRNCDHIDKALVHLEKRILKINDTFLYVREGRKIKKIDLSFLDPLRLDDREPEKGMYKKRREKTDQQCLGVEYEIYGPREGWEREFNVIINNLKRVGWEYEWDGSLPSDGGEIKSPPVPLWEWDKVVQVLEALRLLVEHGKYSGLHVHVSFPEPIKWYEDEFFRVLIPKLKQLEEYIDLPKIFGRGFNKYAKRINGKMNRYCWINIENLMNEIPTLEIRGGSTKAKNYEDLIIFAISMRDIVYGYYLDWKEDIPYKSNPFLYVRKGFLGHLQKYATDKAKPLFQ